MTENIITSDDINYLHDTIMNSTEYDFLLPINEVNGVKCRVNIRSVHKIENTKPEPLYMFNTQSIRWSSICTPQHTASRLRNTWTPFQTHNRH